MSKQKKLSLVRFLDLTKTLKRNEDYPKRDISNINEIILHHTGNHFSPEQIEGQHKDEDLPGSRFHYIIYNGELYMMWPISKITAHTEDWDINTSSVGIAIVGNYDQEKLRFNDKKALKTILLSLSYVIGEFIVTGHMEHETGKCPGINLMKFIEGIRD